MIKPNIPNNETGRIKALRSFHILDTLEEKEYDDITQIASDICNTPVALISLVDSERQWFKSKQGIDASETPRDLAFCAHAINTPDSLFIVNNALEDQRFHDNPLVVGGPQVMFYAGAPLNTKDGYSIGTLCVIDTQPRDQFNEKQQNSLKALASQVMAQLELRRQNIVQSKINEELVFKNDQLKYFTYRLAHDMKTPLHGISSLIGFMKEDYLELLQNTEIPTWLSTIDERVDYMEALINGIINYIQITNSDIVCETFSPKEEILKITGNLSSKKAIELQLDECEVSIYQSRKSFEQILTDLVSNSIKFVQQDDVAITIKYQESAHHYHFTYEDNGPGIPFNYREKVFVMFETLKRVTHTDTGIGLATVKTLIEKLGGTIEIKDRPDGLRGVRFEFSLSKLLN